MNRWVEKEKLSQQTGLYDCELTGRTNILKPRIDHYVGIIPIATNEYLAYKLLMLLKSKGIDVEVANVELQSQHMNNLSHNVAVIQYLGQHSRVSSRKPSEHTFPNWLYWFDKWIARLDCAGDSNLLLVNGKVIPVDFAMSFTWTYPNPKYCHKVDDFEIRIGEEVKAASSDQVKKVIQSISDDELKALFFDSRLNEFLPVAIRAAYYTGLCFRRDHLK